jgi:3-phosphoshikimate 1-carboxyvinyltransferase
MNLHLHQSFVLKDQEIRITGSKSETNRLFLLQALYPKIRIENASNSDDSEVMIKAVQTKDELIDVHHAGTAMRFLTSFFAIQEGKTTILTGSSRMKERPIKILMEALQQLGASIEYLENEGFPPLQITGKKITTSAIFLKADVSSQYISALLLIAPKLENGLELRLVGEITSLPYIKMTLALLNKIDVKTSFESNLIKIQHKSDIDYQTITIESDWSSASYFYSIIALSAIGTQITLSSFKENSLQGDATLVAIFEKFGVETIFNTNNSITVSKSTTHELQPIICNLNNSPDIAQTIAVTCFGLGLECHLTGLHTLKIKETDRLEALQKELSKLGATVSITADSLTLAPSKRMNSEVKIATYNDHRMAMAFAPLALKTGIIIENAEVVSKSYPSFWEDLKKIGFSVSEI